MYTCPLPLGPPSHLPPPRLSQSTSLSSPSSAANSQWPSSLQAVKCMFSWYSLHSSHPLLPPLCPQVSSLCVSIAALQMGSSVPSFWFALMLMQVTDSAPLGHSGPWAPSMLWLCLLLGPWSLLHSSGQWGKRTWRCVQRQPCSVSHPPTSH